MEILIADGSRGVRRLAREALRQTRVGNDTIREAESGDQVLSWIHLRPPGLALALVDWDLPGMDGSSLLGKLEELGVVGDVALLFCVNRSQIPAAEAALRRGARGMLVRPFSDEELRAKVDAIAAQEAAARREEASNVLREIASVACARQDLPSLLSLPSPIISRLFAASSRVKRLSGETLIWPGEAVSGLWVITGGEVEIRPGRGDGSVVRGAGDCVAERAFICGEPARIRAVARTAVEIVVIPKVRMVELARKYASVRAFLAALLEGPAASALSPGEMEGSLESLAFADLVQFLHTGRKTGLLTLEDGSARGVIYFSQGEAHDAETMGKRGEAAFFEMSVWTKARFEFRSIEQAGRRTLERPTMQLLMAACAGAPPGEAAA